MDGNVPHLPHAAQIDAYGNGGFRFAGMSHRGSLLCLPDGIWASPVTRFEDIDERVLDAVFTRAGAIAHCLIGTGPRAALLPEPLRRRFQASGIAVECMATGPAIRTYNILVGERRAVAALLIAVE